MRLRVRILDRMMLASFFKLFLVAICLNFAVRLSRASVQLKNLGQEVAILRAGLDALAAQRKPEDRPAP